MPALPGGQGTGRRILHPEDDGKEEEFKDRQPERVLCPEFGKELEKGSLVTHHQTQNGVAKGGLGSAGDKEDRGSNEPSIYRMEFPTRGSLGPAQSKGAVDGR